jgi:hypothetical protein
MRGLEKGDTRTLLSTSPALTLPKSVSCSLMIRSQLVSAAAPMADRSERPPDREAATALAASSANNTIAATSMLVRDKGSAPQQAKLAAIRASRT